MPPRYRIPDGFFDYDGPYPRAASLAVRRVDRDDPEYPPLLREIPDPPDSLWVAGRDLREIGPCVAIIGARKANEYGLAIAGRLAADLASIGVCVVSGLARGGDAAAHDGALRVGGSTMAMLGCGPDVCYPTSSRTLYAEIAERGAIVSAHPPGTPVMGFRLKDRNRILIGVSRAVIVVQGDESSAAVATGFAAVDLNRECFAVPGSVDWSVSAGVHNLLRKGAKLCASAGDVLEELTDLAVAPPEQRTIPDNLPEPQRRILGALALGSESRDRVIARAGLGTVEGLRAITMLELAGHVMTRGPVVRRIR